MRMTAYVAIAAWMYSLGLFLAIPIWIGLVFGIEIGRNSDYPTLLLGGCGAVLGLAVLVAFMMTTAMSTHGKLFLFFKVFRPHQIVLIAIAWSMVALLFFWLITRIKKSDLNVSTKPE